MAPPHLPANGKSNSFKFVAQICNHLINFNFTVIFVFAFFFFFGVCNMVFKCSSLNINSSPISSSSFNYRLEGKVAVITGGASGIGATIGRILHKNGAKVVIADVQDDLGQELANKLGDDVCYIHCDVSNEDDVINLVDSSVAKHGKLDIIYSNAGTMDCSFGSILDAPKAALEHALVVNTIGGFLVAKHAAKVMVKQREGCILFTTSASTEIERLSTPAYGVSEYGVLGVVQTLAAELGQYGVRVDCVSPSALVSRMSGSKGVCPATSQLSEVGNLKGKVSRSKGIAKEHFIWRVMKRLMRLT